MEKEQKKLLLVAVSVGVFLLVTITAAIILLTPKANTDETAFSSSQPVSPGRIQPVDNVTIPTQPAASQETSNDPESASDHLTIQIPRPSTAAVPDNPEITSSSPSTPVVTTPARPAAVPASAAAQPASTPAVTRSTPARSITDYWIQTGAYSAIVRAEDMKELLASKGLTSIIETRIVDGRNLYRVRLGPYTSEREATYWLALVKSIDGFNDSQIRQTVRQQ